MYLYSPNISFEFPLGAVNLAFRSTQRFALWSIFSPFCLGVQFPEGLLLWEIQHCIVKVLGDPSTTPFSCQLGLLH